MKKIVLLINYLVNGGPSQIVYNLAKSINKKEYVVSLITIFNKNNSTIIEELRANSINVLELNFEKRNYFSWFFLARKVRKIIENENPDIVHSHGFFPDMINQHLNIYNISTLHCNIYEDYKLRYGKLMGEIFIHIHLKSLNKIDKIICCSKSIYEVMNKKINNSCYIRNGSSSRKCKDEQITRSDLNIPNNALVYIYVGTITKRKNVLYLVENFVKYHNLDEYLIILGEGPEMEDCKKLADENIIFLGFRNDVNSYYKISNVYISASLSEGFSMSIIEALDNKLFLFLSNIPSHREVFEIDTNFYLGECFSYDNFIDKLEILRNSIKHNDKNELINFKNLYLSSECMTNQYQNVYDGGSNNGKG